MPVYSTILGRRKAKKKMKSFCIVVEKGCLGIRAREYIWFASSATTVLLQESLCKKGKAQRFDPTFSCAGQMVRVLLCFELGFSLSEGCLYRKPTFKKQKKAGEAPRNVSHIHPSAKHCAKQSSGGLHKLSE